MSAHDGGRAAPALDTELAPFRVDAPLPERATAVLEASAGTGKTWTIASLAARYLAEGTVTLDKLMLVTFSRSATQELRDRVRGRLTELERALQEPGAAGPGDDPVLTLLAAGSASEVAARRRRLATALASFDEATIATTHSFCQRMLEGLGIAADHDGEAALEESDDLLEQVVRDEYLRRFGALEERPFPLRTAVTIARAATRHSRARLDPQHPGGEAGERAAFARAARTLFDLRKRELRRLDYDDLQQRLAEALTDPVRGGAARELLRSAFHVVLVDEFQDTDPVQWEILRAAFHGHATLVLIGDPKQAIYAFRGADVHTYLQAASQADARWTLGTNWRSDAPLVRGLDALWGGLQLGHPQITVRPIAAHHPVSRLVVPGHPAPLRIRRVPRTGRPLTPTGYVHGGSVVEAIAKDVAAEVVELLRSGAVLTDPRDGCERALSPRDIAVLVRTNPQAEKVRDALRGCGVPVVLTGNASVFASEAATHWDTLLSTLEAPHRASLARAAALTPFIGWTAEQVAGADQQELEDLIDRLRGWASVFATGGVAALLEAAGADGLAARVLGRPDGDRLLTDLRHLAEAMNTAARHEHLGPQALLEWLRRRVDESSREAPDELSRRLSTEDEAVQVLTVHRSKGLEFGAVLAPFAWNHWTPDDDDVLLFHDDDGTQVVDVGGPTDRDHAARVQRHEQEGLGEELRLLYVALTRARSLLVVWWAPGWNARTAPLHRVLFGTPDDGALPALVPVPDDEAAAERFAAIARRAAGLVEVQEVAGPRRPLLAVAERPVVTLAERRFTRRIDTTWRRTSYSGLTAAAHAAHYDDAAAVHAAPDAAEAGPEPGTAVAPGDTTGGSEPAEVGVRDEPETAPQAIAPGPGAHDPDADELRAITLPLEPFPGGTQFGSVVHEVLEHLDTTAPDLAAEVLDHCGRVLGPDGGGLDVPALAAALLPVFQTPLDPVLPGTTLAAVAPADRLAEMAFELPLAGGDRAGAGLRLAELADVWAGAVGPDDVLADYPHRLRDELLQGEQLRGFLTGSLDVVIRVRDADGTPRYVVADYKTNRLGTPGEPLRAADYRPAAMAAAMAEVHYPLQAMLYLVALHRYLLWRQPGYDPEVHLGGALYLFVRGMIGPATPVVDGMPCGVFGWRPAAATVLAVSDALAGGAR